MRSDSATGQEPDRGFLSSPGEIIAEARNGRMFILIDDEDRENEGDLIIPAQFATPDAINFMAKHGRGLICLAMTRERIERLGLPLMASNNGSRHQTAFTVSIEASEGVTTGISASDRARTVAAAINPASGPEAIHSPGHVFPLMARDGGVLERAGHTEASVDISRLAGLTPAGVICEIMNEDGTMARLADLMVFAETHGLKIGTVSGLIAYRREHDRIVERGGEGRIDSAYGGSFRLIIYRNTISSAEHVVLIKGEIDVAKPVLVRVHALNVLEDVLGDHGTGRAGQLHNAMRLIAEEGSGVIIMIREPRLTSLSERFLARADPRADLKEVRDYGVGAQILADLGIREMRLITNNIQNLVGLEGHGLRAVGHVPVAAVEKPGAEQTETQGEI
jgi:3,4-dihydroxy 2-butanone 4-phosphate synthase/GTP cyclohydrolase II